MLSFFWQHIIFSWYLHVCIICLWRCCRHCDCCDFEGCCGFQWCSACNLVHNFFSGQIPSCFCCFLQCSFLYSWLFNVKKLLSYLMLRFLQSFCTGKKSRALDINFTAGFIWISFYTYTDQLITSLLILRAQNFGQAIIH